MSDAGPRLRRSRGGVLDLSDPALHELLAAVLERDVPFRFIARGLSMTPSIRDGDVITVAPVRGRALRVGDVVAFRGGEGRLVVHRVVRRSAGSGNNERRLETRGDNCPRSDGSISLGDVMGVVTRVERRGTAVRLGVGPEGALLAGLSRYGALQPLGRRIRALTRPKASATPSGPSPGLCEALSPETRAVLMCAQVVVGTREPAEFRAAVAACSSAERLCHEAVNQGMLGHLHAQVQAQHDASFAVFLAERLDQLSRQAARRSLAQTAHLLRLLDHLQGAGIDVMPIKGPVWGQRLYGDALVRQWVDLDLIVRFEQAGAARRELLSEGLSAENAFGERVLRHGRRSGGELQFRARRGDLHVDLQWQMGVGQSAAALSGAQLLSRAEPLSLLGRQIPTPTETDMLLLTCLHGTRHRWDSVELLLGLAVQVHRTTAPEWPGVMAAARRAGCARRVTIAVAHTCRVFALPLPAVVEDSLARDPVAREFVRSLPPDTLLRRPPQGRREHFASLLWTVAMEDSAREDLAHVAVRVVRPGPQDWEAFSLPAHLEWLYYPLRPFRLFLRLARMAPSRGRDGVREGDE